MLLAATNLGSPSAETRAAGNPAPTTCHVRYTSRFGGEVLAEEGRIVLEAAGDVARVHTERFGTPIPGSPIEAIFMDFAEDRVHHTAELRSGARYTMTTPFSELPSITETAGMDTVLGHECRHATAVVRSNHIDLWFTRELGAQGSPLANLVIEGAVVLKIVRNGNYVIEADSVACGEARGSAPEARLVRPSDLGQIVDAATYRARLAEGYVTTVRVFDREQIAFGNEIENPAPGDTSAVFRHAGGTVIVRRVNLPRMPEDAAVFAEIVEVSNGDAYDRTGSVFLVPDGKGASSTAPDLAAPRTLLDALRHGIEVLPVTRDRAGREYQGIVATEGYTPPIELVRFITPFGVRHYNEQVTVAGLSWEDSTVYKMEVTDLLPILQGPVWIGAFIGNYDKGGHRLSLTLRYHPGSRERSDAPRVRHWVRPLFCTLNLLEMAGQSYARFFETDTLRVSFELPEGVGDVRLRFLTTGHGGWGGGDEFLPKVNELRVDGRVIGRFVPWRADCETYRRSNPASGNFWNGQSSSDFSRSGWCPGAAVTPMTVPLGELAPGPHLVEVAIDMGEPAGESTSSWNVTGVLLGEAPAVVER